MNLPQIDIIQLDNLINPSGTRNLGAGTSGFVKFLDTSSSGHLDYGFLNVTNSGVYAGTKLVFFHPTSMGDALELYNFRFYLYSISAWGTGTYNFLWDKTVHFQSGKALSLADTNVPTSIPTSGNVLSTASGTYIQTIAESGCSQYIYLDLYAGTNVPVGTYGGPGNGGFRYRLMYDFI
jgi:hypothetical protein